MNMQLSNFRPGGRFYTQIVKNGVEGPWEVDNNMVVDQGIMHFLGATLDQVTQNSAFYIALFGGNVTVVSTWTAANFTSNSTEFTNYTESNRVLWANDAAAANSIGNDTTPAVFTIGSGGGTVRGAALLSVATKSSTSGVLIAAARFATDKVLAEDEELRIKYIIGGADA
jgi:hypothetical protein